MNTTGHYYDITLDRWIELPATVIDYTPPPDAPPEVRELDERHRRIHEARSAYYRTPGPEEEGTDTMTPDDLARIARALECIAVQLERLAGTCHP